MKSNLACVLCGAALAVAVTSGPVAAQTAPSIEGSPMQPYHNRDGSVMRGLRGTIVTEYWSGYAVTAGAPYASASATWQVPSVTHDGVSTFNDEAAWLWVGVGGYGDSTLIQLGTASVAHPDGSTSYNAWYELYPAGALRIQNTVRPGDIITASLQCTAACSPSSVQTWQLTISDPTAGWTWTRSFQYQSSMASAEWIVEAPWGGSVYPLADYGQATFDPVEANGLNPNLSLSANGIIMQNPWGETSNASNPVNGDVFSTCWGAIGAPLTPCTASSFTPPPPAATASLSATPAKISAAQSAILTWSSTNASSCIGRNFAASATSGSAAVSPTVTTSYSVTCTGEGGSATALATVTISSPKTCRGSRCK
jgi:hypothetical protein